MNFSIFDLYMVGMPYFFVTSTLRGGFWKMRVTTSTLGANRVAFPVLSSRQAWKPSSWTPNR
ncbi:MAG: hypothetical protein P4M11_11810 [Candidatus Pacebacteria bacterium]|nr:hypothetical protein [Candidatus Paceibacterota bacterium]